MVVHVSAADAPRWVADRLAGRTGTRWVGIDGLGAAGKTTLAGRVAEGLPGAYVVGVDDFARADRPDWDRDLFVAQVLEPLLDGQAARYQRWDLRRDVPLGWVEVPPGRPVVVEGVSCSDTRVPVPWDLVVWVDAPEAVRRARIAARDDAALRLRWEREWWPGEQAYVRAQRPQDRADLTVASWYAYNHRQGRSGGAAQGSP